MSSYLGVPPQSGFITTAKQRITSSTNNYVDLDHSISSLADVIVWVNFVKQDSTNLSLTSSSRITLGATLQNSDIVEISFLGKAVATQTPSSGTVTNDMLAGSIANSKLANSSITLNGSAVSLGGSASVDNTPSFKVNYSGAPNNGQDASNNTYSIATFNGEVFDTDSAYNTSTYKFTVPSGKAGKYFFYFQYYFNETGVGSPRAYIYKNGSQMARFGTYDSGAVSGFNYVMNGVSALDDASVGDYYSAYIYHNSGDAKQVYGGNEASYFMGYKLI